MAYVYIFHDTFTAHKYKSFIKWILTTNILIKWILLIVIIYMTHINQNDIKYFHHIL